MAKKIQSEERQWLKKYKQGNRKRLKKVKGKKVAQKNTSKVSEKEKEIFN